MAAKRNNFVKDEIRKSVDAGTVVKSSSASSFYVMMDSKKYWKPRFLPNDINLIRSLCPNNDDCQNIEDILGDAEYSFLFTSLDIFSRCWHSKIGDI